MSLFSISGLMSGFDTQSIIDAIMDVERIPVTRLQNKKAGQQALITAFQSMSAKLLSMKVNTSAFLNDSTYQGRTVTSSNEEIVTASVSSASSAGVYQLENITLATSHRISGATFEDSSEELGLAGDIMVNGTTIHILEDDSLSQIASRINSAVSSVSATILSVSDTDKRLVLTSKNTGADNAIALRDANDSDILQTLGLTNSTMTVDNGISDGAASGNYTSDLTALGQLMRLDDDSPLTGTIQIIDDAETVDVAIDLSTDTLQSIADKINAASTGSVAASVVEVEEDGQTYYRLEVTGTVTPAGDPFGSANFTDDNNILEAMGFLTAGFANQLTGAQDASFELNGIAMTRATNIVSDAVEGMTFTLNKETSEETVTLSVLSNTDSVVTQAQNLVKNFNSTIDFIKQQTYYNSDTGAKGALLSDGTTRDIKTALTGMMTRRTPMLSISSLTALNDGAGVSLGEIKITDREGTSETIDLSSAVTVQDVIDLINQSDLNVTAAINGAGTGLMITDTSTTITGSLRVEEVDGGSTASDLGILGTALSSQLIGQGVAEAEFFDPTQMGFSLLSDGTLSLNTGTLQKMLSENPSKVQAFFRENTYGFAKVFDNQLKAMTNSISGTLQVKQNGIQAVIDDIDDRIESYQNRLSVKEEQLKRQYVDLEVALSGMQSQAEYLAGQLQGISDGWYFNRRR